MITIEYCREMARYNAWQNRGQMEIFKSMKPAELRKDRKAFFGSIFATANHLLWADQLWMSRFDGGLGPKSGGADSVNLHDDLQLFLDDRLRTDARIERWAKGLNQIDLVGPLAYYSAMSDREFSKPMALCAVHFFNHQTHHRGQIHAMLTAAGHRPYDTDLVLMPDDA
ncbi:putative damage-inducible protein DinB [Litoreibacter meonggei]|uniref:Putative damage-inducible protein DinB n=1 Tax=Litoreibacter meonggei TaxID=1049199 RepID=A0A497X229_9RHOB|nr:DinB family protein [Litoreibacter meonggei]RLJ59962.1 putative damage-inducible protein DinB [Litoreibacter meonggei]